MQAQIYFETESNDLKVLPGKVKTEPRIVNGRPATQDQYPHQALIFINTLQGTYQCGGSLLNSLWVLSAAHCVIG